MIGHKVLIGGIDVSHEVKSIKCQSNILTDSDPAKITIVLVNRHQMYTNAFTPQVIEIQAILYNYTYKNQPKEFPIFWGNLTDLSSNHLEATVQGECLLGHYADALPKDNETFDATPKQALYKVMGWHTDYKITIVWDPALDKNSTIVERFTYGSDQTYADVIQDISDKVGAVYYTNEQKGVIEFRSPYTTNPEINLDPYVKDPCQANSIVGYCNWVVVVGDQSEVLFGPGVSTSGSQPIIYHAKDEESIAAYGVLAAPTYFDSTIKTIDQAKAKAEQLLAAYELNVDAETKVTVVGMSPLLQTEVSYAAFAPISPADLAEAKKAAVDILKEMQDLEDAYAKDKGIDSIQLELSGRIKGVIVEKDTTYDIDGFECTLTISRGMLGPGQPIGNDTIMPTVRNPDWGN